MKATDYHGNTAEFTPGLRVQHVDDEGRFHAATVTEFDEANGSVHLDFDDGDEGWESCTSCCADADIGPPLTEAALDRIRAIHGMLSGLDSEERLMDLPDSEFQTGGAVTRACHAAGYSESGWVAVNQLAGWGMTVAQLRAFLSAQPDGE